MIHMKNKVNITLLIIFLPKRFSVLLWHCQMVKMSYSCDIYLLSPNCVLAVMLAPKAWGDGSEWRAGCQVRLEKEADCPGVQHSDSTSINRLDFNGPVKVYSHPDGRKTIFDLDRTSIIYGVGIGAMTQGVCVASRSWKDKEISCP